MEPVGEMKRQKHMRTRVLLVAASLVLAGCALDDEAGQSSTTTTGPDVTSTTRSQDEATTTTTGGEELPDEAEVIAAAIADLARRLDIDGSDVSVVDAKSVEWSDGSLGCPQPGQLYTQAIVDGAQVLLGADGRLYDYRADADGNIVFCASDEKDGGREFVPPPSFDD